MADFCAVTIPLAEIRRIQIYLNPQRKTLTAIKKETGANYLLNGTLYNMTTGKVNCHLKVDGQAIAKPGYTVQGLEWDTGPDIAMSGLPSGKRSYIACTPLIVGGRKLDKLTYDGGQDGKRGRSAIGLKGDRLALYCTRDGSASGRTPEQLRDDLHAAGWESAIMLDGGGSSQCDFAGQAVPSGRCVQHLILVYLKEKKGETDMNGATVKAYSKAKDGGKALSKNFAVKEFACADGSDAVFVSPELVTVLQKIREHFGKPVSINSAFRTAAHNEKVGGAPQSQHLYGMAADVHIAGVTPKAIAAYAETLLLGSGGIGVYDGFCHVDVRAARSRW